MNLTAFGVFEAMFFRERRSIQWAELLGSVTKTRADLPCAPRP